MHDKANSPAERLDNLAPDDDEVTRPVSLELIARLAAQDPTVQLKVGVPEWTSDLQVGDVEKKTSK